MFTQDDCEYNDDEVGHLLLYVGAKTNISLLELLRDAAMHETSNKPCTERVKEVL